MQGLLHQGLGLLAQKAPSLVPNLNSVLAPGRIDVAHQAGFPGWDDIEVGTASGEKGPFRRYIGGPRRSQGLKGSVKRKVGSTVAGEDKGLG